ncbi:MAG: hypothetical protein IPP30_09125 [Flavobacterium sp.]|nr:hypothetical protein [Flavobacterium sp.]
MVSLFNQINDLVIKQSLISSFTFVTLVKINLMELNWITIGGLLIIVVIVVFFLIKRNRKDEDAYENFLNENDLPIEKEEDEANNY